VRLEGADWNDGLDMAKERGESVAFSCMYAHNLALLADLLLKSGRRKIPVFAELKILLGKVNYDSCGAKRKILEQYFARIQSGVSGKKVNLDVLELAGDLQNKSAWMTRHIREKEWLAAGFFNGYYDNKGRRVEGRRGSLTRMTLTGQVFPIMSGTATDGQIRAILKSVKKYLLDKKTGGLHLNTDFRQEQHEFGRAFSFIYGDKENGAFFNHMVVMFAYALYTRGFSEDAWKALSSIYRMAVDTGKSKIYPCLPEYFNLEGRGMYSYLTGSASWYVLTLITRAFGIKGKDGDLLIEPKLAPAQFPEKGNISISRTFAGRKFRITFANPQGLSRGKYKIVSGRLNNRLLPLAGPASALIRRRDILKLAPLKTHSLEIILR
jgi:cellobiose phosphorylase